MLATVILPEGPREMEIVPIPDSPDNLAIIRDLADDPTATSIAAQIPGHEAWTPMGSPLGVSHPDFPVGNVAEYLEEVIKHLPQSLEKYLTGQKKMAPSHVALARYLKIVTPDCERQLAELQAAVQREITAEDGESIHPTPEDDLDRQLKEREELRASLTNEARKADMATYHGFLDGKSSDEVSLLRKDLERLVLVENVMNPPVKSVIEHYVSIGCVIDKDPKGHPILVDPATNTYLRQQDLTKSGIEYAKFLISIRAPKT